MPSKMENFGFWLSQTFASTKAKQTEWPYVPGTYFVSDPGAPVAVCTLGSVDLAPLVAAEPPEGLCITGKVETENIGIESTDSAINYKIAVHYWEAWNYGASTATVRVYWKQQLLKQFGPKKLVQDDWWEVATINGQEGEITVLDSVCPGVYPDSPGGTGPCYTSELP